ncbi:MAG TPA: hypothetical protein VFE96_02415 [Candidatus Bathyarchaeia archaeon]|nr:hypothetical protein [Candidatus Bathyarchaeia archaeon]
MTKVPVYIVGLDVQDLESSMAESKFRRSIESLSHVYPDIAEARAMVKSFSSEKQRRHYEAHVLIRMSRHQFEFNEEAWSVEEVFENVGVKIKRLMTKPRDSPARRRSLSRGEAEQARY